MLAERKPNSGLKHGSLQWLILPTELDRLHSKRPIPGAGMHINARFLHIALGSVRLLCLWGHNHTVSLLGNGEISI